MHTLVRARDVLLGTPCVMKDNVKVQPNAQFRGQRAVVRVGDCVEEM